MTTSFAPDPDAAARLLALERYAILDTSSEPAFDDLVLLASQICETPIALISVITSERQWFKARTGFSYSEVPIDHSVCRHALGQHNGLLVIPDLSLDLKTWDNPVVTDEPHLRFYAGAPLSTPDDVVLGTLCVIDTEPRPEGLTAAQSTALEALARQAMAQMELRRVLAERAAAAVRKSEQRLRDALSIKTVGVLFWGPGLRLVEVNDAFLSMSGFSREEALGKFWQQLTPEDFHPASQDAIAAVMAHGECAPFEKRYFRKDGSCWWGMFAARKVGDEVVEFVLDITNRKQAEDRLRAVANLVPDFLWNSDPDGRVNWFSDRWYAYTGQTEMQALGHGWLDAIHPEDREEAMASFLATMKQRKPYRREHRIASKDGVYRWFLVRAEPVLDAVDLITQCYGTVTEIHDLRQLQERQAVLVAELQHRTRNLLGVVHSVAQQTMKNATSLTAFWSQFNDRLSALSRVQGMLSRSEQEPITIRTLIQHELEALGAAGMQDRIVLNGPTVPLRKSTVQTFALALHELATNARKYGALSSDQGHLSVTWLIYTGEDGNRRLLVRWVEEGVTGASAGQRDIRRGYGRELIEKALPYALQAMTSYELGEVALQCSIDLPLA